jgi:hypothetical protein
MCGCAAIGTFLAFICPIAIAALLHELWRRWMLERSLYLSPSRTSLADVRQLVRQGCRKEAILRYREKFPQVDLREAVYAVDHLR